MDTSQRWCVAILVLALAFCQAQASSELILQENLDANCSAIATDGVNLAKILKQQPPEDCTSFTVTLDPSVSSFNMTSKPATLSHGIPVSLVGSLTQTIYGIRSPIVYLEGTNFSASGLNISLCDNCQAFRLESSALTLSDVHIQGGDHAIDLEEGLLLPAAPMKPIVLTNVVLDGPAINLRIRGPMELTLHNVQISNSRGMGLQVDVGKAGALGHLFLHLSGNISFDRNQDSALQLGFINATIIATGPTTLSFTNNMVKSFGTFACVGDFLTFDGPQTDLIFNNNVAKTTGSAMMMPNHATIRLASFKVLNSFTLEDFGEAFAVLDVKDCSITASLDIILDTSNSACIASAGMMSLASPTLSLTSEEGDILISNCGGGGIHSRTGSVELTAKNRIRFFNNTRFVNMGGAIQAYYPINLFLSAPTIEFENNAASQGGAIDITPRCTVSNGPSGTCTSVLFNATESLIFRNNRAIPKAGRTYASGGALQLGNIGQLPEFLSVQWPQTASIVFDGNRALQGGAIFTPNITIIRHLYNNPNVVFVNNKADYGCAVAGRVWPEALALELDAIPVAHFANNSISATIGPVASSFMEKPIYRSAVEEYQCSYPNEEGSCPPRPSIGEATHWYLGPNCTWNYFTFGTTSPLVLPPLTILNGSINVYGNVESSTSHSSRIYLTQVGASGLPTFAIHGNLSVALSIKVWTSLEQATALVDSISSSSIDLLQLRRNTLAHHPVFSTTIYDNPNHFLDGLFGLEAIEIPDPGFMRWNGLLVVYLYSFGDLALEAVAVPPVPTQSPMDNIPSTPSSSPPGTSNISKYGLPLSIAANILLVFVVIIGLILVLRSSHVCCFASSKDKGFDAYVQTDDEHYNRYEQDAPLLGRGL